ncbi:MAG TPA: pilus assembly PilX N-terminal domain-containing protein [Candidatus Saccharimonadia bacterium]
MNQPRTASGFIMLTVLIMAFILSALGMIGAQLLIANARFGQYENRSNQALNVAEAGINYYLWHLSHNNTDFTDGNGNPTGAAPYGPYVHNEYDTDGNLLGTYTLYVTPPSGGSTITTVKSIGQVPRFSGTRTILAQLGRTSFANFALLTATEFWVAAGESTTGPVMSNVGVHMDGTNNGPVMSGSATYKPTPAFGGDGSTHNGVWGNGGPTSQWQYPVTPIDFTGVTADYNSCITQAQANGKYFAKTNKKGYYFKLKSNGTIDEYIVQNETSSGLTFTTGSPIQNFAAPTNGILYVEDNVWVEGTGWPGRIDIMSGRLPDQPATNTSITVVGNLTYAAKDGTDVIGLIAQKDIIVPAYAPNTIEINAAALSQKGHVYYPNSGGLKSTLTFYGSIDTYDYWTWSWVNGGGNVISGYPTNTTQFDSSLVYGPPPCYPTTGNYAVLNWREQLYNP